MSNHEILLTGAAGFLGAHLAAELLRDPRTHAYLLVKARDAGTAERKVEEAALRYGLTPLPARRFTVLPADLATPDLAVTNPAVPAAIDRVGTVIHAAAKVHLGMSYDSLKPVNVDGTRQLLRAALAAPGVRFHHISTLSVFSSPETVAEVLEIPPQPGLGGGYEQSKWVAERIVALASTRGLPVAIHRTGRLFGNSRTGGFNPRDLLIQLLNACFALGVAPELRGAVEFEPVDLVAARIVRIARESRDGRSRAHHHQGRIAIPWSHVLGAVDSHQALATVPYPRWLTLLREAPAAHAGAQRLATILDEREPFATRTPPAGGFDPGDPEFAPYLAALRAIAPRLGRPADPPQAPGGSGQQRPMQ